jgi:hypothetical protein
MWRQQLRQSCRQQLLGPNLLLARTQQLLLLLLVLASRQPSK